MQTVSQKIVTTHQVTIAGDSLRETNEPMHQFSFYPVTTGQKNTESAIFYRYM